MPRPQTAAAAAASFDFELIATHASYLTAGMSSPNAPPKLVPLRPKL